MWPRSCLAADQTPYRIYAFGIKDRLDESLSVYGTINFVMSWLLRFRFNGTGVFRYSPPVRRVVVLVVAVVVVGLMIWSWNLH